MTAIALELPKKRRSRWELPLQGPTLPIDDRPCLPGVQPLWSGGPCLPRWIEREHAAWLRARSQHPVPAAVAPPAPDNWWES